jgi:proliferating cell nuclear antigen
MSNTQQTTVFGDVTNPELTIETTGRVIRPWKRMLSPIAGEHKLHVQDKGIYVKSVDPANVAMIETTLHATAFQTYNVKETTLGIQMDALGSLCQHARYGKRTDDKIRLQMDEARYMDSHVTRDVGGTEMTFRERRGLTDPASIRESPDMPDNEYTAAAQMAPETYTAAVTAGDWDTAVFAEQTSDGIRFYEDDNDRPHSRSVELSTESLDDDATAIFSKDYMENIARGVENGLVDTVVVRWAEQYPIEVWFDRPGVYTGRYMMAPRIRSD